MILAADEHGSIGFKNGLPWPKLKEDLNWFRQLTEMNVVVMGSNTWKSLGVHAPLTSRHNYVITFQASKHCIGPYSKKPQRYNTVHVVVYTM